MSPEDASRPGLHALVIAALFAAVVAAVALAGASARKLRLEQMSQLAALQAERHAGELAAELGRFDHLPDIIRFHPSIVALLERPNEPEVVDAANRYLEHVNAAAGSAVLYVLDIYGTCIASSNWRDPTSFVGVDLSYRPYFRDALRSGAQHFYGIGTTSGVPGYFSARAIPGRGDARGVGVVKVERWHAGSWPGAGRMMIVDGNGVIVLSSEDAWRYRTIGDVGESARARIRVSRQYENVPLKPLGLRTIERIDASTALVALPEDLDGGEAMTVERPLQGSDWKVVVLLDVSEARDFSFWAQLVVALMASTLALFVLYLVQRRRAIEIEREARAALAEANSALEGEVESRTRDLIEANNRLQNAQDELVHSAKLAAIGQIAAGVTHELSQPMAAIRSLADNANVFLAREQRENVIGNLRLISDLVDRMSGITSQLKIFARKRPPVLAAVPLRPAMDESLLLLDEKVRRTGAHVSLDIDDDLLVRADSDRLAQVFVNILSNALDAMAGAPSPRIEIAAQAQDGRILLRVRDSGPGLAPAVLQRLFEPFFTTKLAGSGLGLGLAISERILRDFGGAMRAENAAGGGALFTIELQQAQAVAATG